MGEKMNREIKFRAWDLDKKQMNFCIFVGIGKIFNMTKFFKPKEELKNSVLMQYTGLIDINGKEIYEGDIVKSYGGIFRSTVEFKNGIFEPFNASDNCSFYANECEIIGNVYENPELLERKK